MAELADETNHEIELVKEDEEEMEDGAYDSLMQPNTTFLPELNLITIVLSLFSLSPEDCMSHAESEMKSATDHEAKACISRLHTRRQETHEFKLAGRRAQKFQPMIKDCRHGRRL